MDKIKRYVNLYIPVTTCTLRCHYCYITHHRLFEGPLPELKYSAEQVRKALSKERLGGVCLINICGGGETLLPPKVLDYVRVLLEEGHYVMIVTNATLTKRFDEIATWSTELTHHLFFKFSYHYLQFKERNLFDTVFNNIRKMRDAGCSFTLEVTPSDELIPFIKDLSDLAVKEIGAVPHVTIARDERDPSKLPILTDMSNEDYYKTWDVFHSQLFEYKNTIFNVKRHEFCYAGDWSFLVNAATGNMNQCYGTPSTHNIFDHPERPIPFRAVGNHCRQHHCYNGHSFLILGCIPELYNGMPTYSELRNRVSNDGKEWLQSEMKAMMSSRLGESNKELSGVRKRLINLLNLTSWTLCDLKVSLRSLYHTLVKK